MIQLTEDEFKEIRDLIIRVINHYTSYTPTDDELLEMIRRAKSYAWIKKTALEEAELIAEELIKNRLVNLGINSVLEMISYYRKAIKEIQEKSK